MFVLQKLKGASSEIVGEWIFIKPAVMVTFPTNISRKMEKKMQMCILFASAYMLLIVS